MILITGSTGRLGEELAKAMPNALTPDHVTLDIEDFQGVRGFFLRNQSVSTIIHSAALTSAEACEKNPQRALNVNTIGTHNLSYWASNLLTGCRFVLVSTCVFDGARGDYGEAETPSPINTYQYTKAMAETAVTYLMKNYAIVRTNFIQRSPWPYSAAFVDRFANYLFVDQVAKAIKEISESKIEGVVHVSGSRKLSMYDVAKMTTDGVKKLTLQNYSGPKVPKDMSLKSTRWKTYDM